MSLVSRIGRVLLSLPGRAWSLARRVVHAERAVEGVAGLDEPVDAAPFDQPLAVDNPFYQEHELFPVRVTAVQSGLRKVTAVRRRATDVNTFEDDPTDTAPITVGVVAGQMPHVGDLLRAWYDGLNPAGDPIYHALGNGDGFGKVEGVGDDGAGHVQIIVRRSALAFTGGVWTESDPAEFITAYALPQRRAVFRIGDHVTLYRVGSTWAAAATETGSRFSDADTVVEPAHELKFGTDIELSREAPGVARADLKTALDANARVAVRVNAGPDLGKRRRFNFDNASSNVAAEIQDDPAAEEFDVRLIHDGRLKATPTAPYGFLVDALEHLAPLHQTVVGDVLRVGIDPAGDTSPGVVQGGGPGFHVDGAGVGSVNFGLGAAQALEGSTATASPGAADKVPLTGSSGKIDAEFIPDAGPSAAGKVSTGDQTFAGKKTFTPTATKAGVNVGSASADPGTPTDGDLWHVSGGSFHARLDGVTAKLAAVPTGDFAAGDVLYAATAAAKTLSRLPIGAAGKVLGVSGGLPAWVDPPSSGAGDRLASLTASEVSITGATALDATAFGKLHRCGGSSAYTVTLPAAAGNGGKFVALRSTANAGVIVTIDGNGAETINGYATLPLLRGHWLTLYCDGSGWSVVEHGPGDLPVAAVVASNAATVDFVGYMSGAGKVYTLEGIDVHPSTNSTALWLRTGNGGVFDSGAGSYRSSCFRDVDGTTGSAGSTSDTKILLATSTNNWGNAADSGGCIQVEIPNPADTTYEKHVWCRYTFQASDGAFVAGFSGGQHNSTAAVTDVRLLFSSGSISGSFILRERRLA